MPEFSNPLNIICLESEAFYTLIDEVVARLKAEQDHSQDSKWISDEKAMQLSGEGFIDNWPF